jgi:hypothetical protein
MQQEGFTCTAKQKELVRTGIQRAQVLVYEASSFGLWWSKERTKLKQQPIGLTWMKKHFKAATTRERLMVVQVVDTMDRSMHDAPSPVFVFCDQKLVLRQESNLGLVAEGTIIEVKFQPRDPKVPPQMIFRCPYFLRRATNPQYGVRQLIHELAHLYGNALDDPRNKDQSRGVYIGQDGKFYRIDPKGTGWQEDPEATKGWGVADYLKHADSLSWYIWEWDSLIPATQPASGPVGS